MKSCIVIFTSIFLLLQIAACKKETIEPVPDTIEIVVPVVDTTSVVQPVVDSTFIDEPVADTTTIVPWPPSPAEVVFENLYWLYRELFLLEIPHFGQRLPPGAVFKIYIKRWASPQWIEVPFIGDNSTSLYGYSAPQMQDSSGIYNPGSLIIYQYGQLVNDGPSVKIVY